MSTNKHITKIAAQVGESEKAVSKIFSTARRCNPCVIFLDELEAIFGSREANGNLANKVNIIVNKVLIHRVC
jgi:SpoVK/Ycf46/Vps4 family AAA+-type ATPase